MSNNEHKIKVHDKVLAHLSKGLYRSPASALRELVSNAWDASATTVRIDTNFPNFLQVTVSDNGDGFDREAFFKHMEGNIGNSFKREQKTGTAFGRPLIGRLGIGLLGIAQICGGFRIASVPKQGKAFQAKVVLEDNLKERLDDRNVDENQSQEADLPFEIGKFYEEDLTIPISGTGTVVVADDIHPAFARSFQASLGLEEYETPPLQWSRCVETLKSKHSLQQMGDYWRLLWELSASCPVPYLAENAVPSGLIEDDQKRLQAYNFKVIVDSRQLFKPIQLSDHKHGYTTARVRFDERVYDKQVKLHGYLVAQEAKNIQPDELRGILIRIKNVGIGYYDQTLLDYRYNEGPRSRWVTGELYIDQGLEDSLNIDRDSFNRFDPEYRAVQEYVHTILREQVFKPLYKNIDVRSDQRAIERTTARTAALGRALEDLLTDRQLEPEQSAKVVAQFLEKRRGPDTLPTKKANRELASAVIALHDASRIKLGDDGSAFKSALLKLLKEW